MIRKHTETGSQFYKKRAFFWYKNKLYSIILTLIMYQYTFFCWSAKKTEILNFIAPEIKKEAQYCAPQIFLKYQYIRSQKNTDIAYLLTYLSNYW